MSLEKQWWCIKAECKHHNVHSTHKGTVINTTCCKHPDVIKQKSCTTPAIGQPIDKMEMCPILYDMNLDK